MKKYYLYRHIRLDKNEPFYIGIGKVSNEVKDYSIDSEHYRRAYSKRSRNRYWKNIVNTTEYSIEVLFESDDKNFIIQKEIEFIKLYGRKDLKLGILVNMTDGGEGIEGNIRSEATKLKQSISAKVSMVGKRKEECIKRLNDYHPTKGKFGKDHPRTFIVYQYDLQNNFIKDWESLADIKRILNYNIPHISQCVNNKRKTAFGFKWYKERI